MRIARVRYLFVLVFAGLGGCAGRAPAPIDIDGCRLTLSSAGVTELLKFTTGDRRVHGLVTLVIDEVRDRPDRFGAPVPQLLGVYDQKGHQLLGSSDTTRLDVKISDAMDGRISSDHSGGHGKFTFGFGMKESLSRVVRVEGILEISRVTDLTVIEVSLAEVAEFHEIADRCRVRASVSAANSGKVQLTVTVELAVTEASRAAPNAPIRIEAIADDGSILGVTKVTSGSSGSKLIVRQSTLTTALPESSQISGLLFHIARAVEWDEHSFAFEKVPLRGRIAQ